MLRKHLACGLIGLVIYTQAAPSVWAENIGQQQDALAAKESKAIQTAKANAAKFKASFVVVKSRGGSFKGKVEGRLIRLNENDIVLADVTNR